MIRALYSAASGMTAQQLNVDNIANNLANANTAGYKMRRAQFQDLLYQNMVQPGAGGRPADRGAHGPAARPGHARLLQRDHLHAGRLLADRQPARHGDPGQRLLPGAAGLRATWPTRAPARSTWTSDGNIVTSDGDPLEPQITIPPDAQTHHHRARTAPSATRSRTRPPRSRPGQIQLANFQNPAGLNSLGGNLYLPTDASGDPTVGTPGRPGGPGHAAAGLRRAVERLGGGGVHQPDRGAARLRGQFQSGQGRRRDVPAGQQPHPMIRLAAFALAGCLAVGAGSDHILARRPGAGLPGAGAAALRNPDRLAPAPGVRRVFRAPELRRLAAALERGPGAPMAKSASNGRTAPLDPAPACSRP